MTDADLKFQRAISLYEEFQLATKNFMANQPARLEIIKNEDGIVQVTLRVTSEAPEELSLLLGEFLHNARSALDAALYRLIDSRSLKLGKSFRRDRIALKIADNEGDFLGDKCWHQNMLTEAEIARIARFQPFHLTRLIKQENRDELTKLTPLSRLRDLSNTDKHRNLKFMYVGLNMLMISTERENILTEGRFYPFPWVDGTLIYSYKDGNSIEKTPIITPEFNLALKEDIAPINVRSIEYILESIIQQTGMLIQEIQEFKP